MKITLDDIQSRIASIIDLNETTSDLSSTEYSLRRQYINMSQREWAESHQWRSLYREYNVLVSTSTGNASISLPVDFRKAASKPKITWDGSTTEYFTEIHPSEKGIYSNNAKYVIFLGDKNSGQVMYINAETLVSGASIQIPYYRSPASLVSPADVAMCPNPEYIVQRSLAYIWESKGDGRFLQAKQEAEKILRNLIYKEVPLSAGAENKIITPEKKMSFRWGL